MQRSIAGWLGVAGHSNAGECRLTTGSVQTRLAGHVCVQDRGERAGPRLETCRLAENATRIPDPLLDTEVYAYPPTRVHCPAGSALIEACILVATASE